MRREISAVSVGSTIFDLVARAPRVPREGEVVVASGLRFFQGGKGANRAIALARLGARTTLISAVGDDANGRFALEGLAQNGVDTAWVKQSREAVTGCSWIAVLPSGNNATWVDPAANLTLAPEDVARADDVIRGADAVAADLEVSLDAVEAALRMAREAGKLTVLDAGPPGRCPPEILALADIVSPNEPELEALTGERVSDVESAGRAAARLVGRGTRTVVVKLGRAGSLLVTKDGREHFPPCQVDAVDPTGAGDAFTAALTVRLAEGAAIADAIRYANRAGALAVTRLGAAPSLPTRDEIEAFAARR
ncbi:MAG TPA: PfkB family carbohydrate kinase [Terriglobia bacterium]|nr:PfkB family carbohydrate kinase [Terriglobia bacterium]